MRQRASAGRRRSVGCMQTMSKAAGRRTGLACARSRLRRPSRSAFRARWKRPFCKGGRRAARSCAPCRDVSEDGRCSAAADCNTDGACLCRHCCWARCIQPVWQGRKGRRQTAPGSPRLCASYGAVRRFWAKVWHCAHAYRFHVPATSWCGNSFRWSALLFAQGEDCAENPFTGTI